MDSQSQNNEVSEGQLKSSYNYGEFNNISFLVSQEISKLQTATLVRVESCTNDGGLSPVGLVDVVPLVDQMDGEGKSVPHVTIYNVPYFRCQGGSNAIILDPKIGDIGVCVFASRDITKVKATKKQSLPGSLRQYSFSDGLYLGGMLNGTPTQYVQFTDGGVKIYSPNSVTIEAPKINIVGSVTLTGSMTSSGDVKAQGTSVHTHVHGGVQQGGDNTGGPK